MAEFDYRNIHRATNELPSNVSPLCSFQRRGSSPRAYSARARIDGTLEARQSGVESPEGARVIVPPTGVRVLVATKPVDFRRGMDGLAAYVQEHLKTDPFCGIVYVFRAKRADRVKLLFWDGTGICLLSKRLEGGRFRWPAIDDGVMRLSPAQLSALLEPPTHALRRGLPIKIPR